MKKVPAGVFTDSWHAAGGRGSRIGADGAARDRVLVRLAQVLAVGSSPAGVHCIASSDKPRSAAGKRTRERVSAWHGMRRAELHLRDPVGSASGSGRHARCTGISCALRIASGRLATARTSPRSSIDSAHRLRAMRSSALIRRSRLSMSHLKAQFVRVQGRRRRRYDRLAASGALRPTVALRNFTSFGVSPDTSSTT